MDRQEKYILPKQLSRNINQNKKIILLLKLIKTKANGFPHVGEGVARIVNWYKLFEADEAILNDIFKNRYKI